MKYFKNFYNSPKKFPDPEEFLNRIESKYPIILAQHTRSCVWDLGAPPFVRKYWKRTENICRICREIPRNFPANPAN
jgi:hypothetical protein